MTPVTPKDAEDPTDVRPPRGEFADLEAHVMEYVKAREQGTDWRSLLQMIPRAWLIGIVFALTSGVVSLAGTVLGQYGRQDLQRDQAIHDLSGRMYTQEKITHDLEYKVELWIDIANEVRNNQRSMLEESYREYRAQARARGDQSSVARYSKKLEVIDRQNAAAGGQP